MKLAKVFLFLYVPSLMATVVSQTSLTSNNYRSNIIQNHFYGDNIIFVLIDKYQAHIKYPKKYTKELLVLDYKDKKEVKVTLALKPNSSCNQFHIIRKTLVLRCENKLSSYTIERNKLKLIKNKNLKNITSILNSQRYLVIKQEKKVSIYDTNYLPIFKKIRTINEGGKYTFLKFFKNRALAYYQPGGKNDYKLAPSLALINTSNILSMKTISKVKLKEICCVFDVGMKNEVVLLHDFEMQKLMLIDYENEKKPKIIYDTRSKRYHSPKFFKSKSDPNVHFTVIDTDFKDKIILKSYVSKKNITIESNKYTLNFGGGSYSNNYLIKNNTLFLMSSTVGLVIEKLNF